jgi:hypothetical protein
LFIFDRIDLGFVCLCGWHRQLSNVCIDATIFQFLVTLRLIVLLLIIILIGLSSTSAIDLLIFIFETSTSSCIKLKRQKETKEKEEEIARHACGNGSIPNI